MCRQPWKFVAVVTVCLMRARLQRCTWEKACCQLPVQSKHSSSLSLSSPLLFSFIIITIIVVLIIVVVFTTELQRTFHFDAATLGCCCFFQASPQAQVTFARSSQFFFCFVFLLIKKGEHSSILRTKRKKNKRKPAVNYLKGKKKKTKRGFKKLVLVSLKSLF